MSVPGLVERGFDSSYAPEQVRAILRSIGVEVVGETPTNFLCYCPAHPNNNSPAFSVGRENGLAICYRSGCALNSGHNLEQLVMALTDKDMFQARRYIAKRSAESRPRLSDRLQNIFEPPSLPYYPQMAIDADREALQSNSAAKWYLHGRGFTKDTVDYFEVGYKPDMDMVVTPVHDHTGQPVGFNGRSIEGKQFHLSKGIPRKELVFNVHRAKRYPTAIVCESQFDAMLLHQYGFPNAVCGFGSYFSRQQMGQLERFFERVIIMTDNDEPGRKAGETLAAGLNVSVLWASYDGATTIYPDGCKDVGEMTEQQARACVENAMMDFEYQASKDQMC